MIRVLVVDDHPVVRGGLCWMFEGVDDIVVVGEAGSGSRAVELARSLRPDVVLMDLRMPGYDGVAATAAIVQAVPETKVLVLSSYDNETAIDRAVEAGASGYLLKDAGRHPLLAAVRGAARGETVLAPAVAAKLLGRVRRPHPKLTGRELDVLGHAVDGATNAQIASRLGIGESTVKSHLVNAFAKLGVADRTAAVTRAISLGLVRPPP